MAYILLADDDQDLVWAVRHCLDADGHEVATAGDGAAALGLASRRHPDLVIVDIVMPGLDGFEVCQRLRRDPTLAAVPILMLTGRGAVEDRLRGLDAGADDYLTKPFDMRELRSRVKALLRRSRPPSRPDFHSLVVGPLALDANTRQVSVNEKTCLLTPVQFRLLYYLMSHAGKVFSERELLEEVWGYPPDVSDPGLVRWHIKKLRDKVEPDPAHPVYIRTVPRHGYILAVPLEEPPRETTRAPHGPGRGPGKRSTP